MTGSPDTHTQTELRRTPLWEVHRQLGARMVPFAGFDMPVQYEGLVAEHTAVRRAVGLFDVSHMGEFRITGRGAPEALSNIVTGDVIGMAPGSALYTLVCRPNGGVVDDVIVYRLSKDSYFICVNAANEAKDAQWFTEHLAPFGKAAQFENVSSYYGQIAVQGPHAAKLVSRITDTPIGKLPYYHFIEAKVLGTPALVARTGYTGELGYELYFEASKAASIWTGLMENGADLGVKPCGLGARDTLRLEVGFGLYGQDMDDEHTPYESGVAWTLAKARTGYIGAEALEKQAALDTYPKLVGFRVAGGPVPRQGHLIFATESGGEPVGRVTSGAPSPSVGDRIGFCRLERPYAGNGTPVWIEIRQKRSPVTTCGRIFYKEGTAKADPSKDL